ncbi:MAG: hypothetical protein MUF52_00090 [Syntrophobacteraceae bacterium]|jgi:hypothetical protein|nr:hypothetical protein [Syntrophobacteraceae bacterium]
MRVFKLITSALVVGIILIFIGQNLTAFRTPVRFTLDLFIREPVSWEHSVYGLMLMSAFAGLVLGALALLRPYIHTRRLLAEKRAESGEPNAHHAPRDGQAPSEASSPPLRSETSSADSESPPTTSTQD